MELTLQVRCGIGIFLCTIFSFSVYAQNNCPGIQIRYGQRYATYAARCGVPSMVTFRNITGGSRRTNAEYKWYINDSLIGQSIGMSDINFNYTDTGVYQLKIVATVTSSLCTDSLESQFLVYNRPNPTIISSRDTVCAGTMVYFHPTVKDSWRYSNYYWRFPDNTSSRDTSVGFLFTNTGNRRVQLRVRNTSQCERWVTKYIYVTSSPTTLRLNDLNGNPSASPVWENCILSAGAVDTFQLILTTPDSIFNYTVDFGDGTTLNGGTDTFFAGKAIYHTYQQLGTYTLVVVGEDANGCKREVRGTVVNERIPTAGIIGPPSGNQSGCAPLAVRFINNSYNISKSTTFSWTFGDGSNQLFPSGNASDTIWHTYLKDAADCDLEVTLTAQNACGNSIATWAYVNVFDEDDVSLSASNGIVCLPDSEVTLNVNIDRNCVGGQRFYYWDFGDGRNSGWTTSAAPRTVVYNKAGTYSALIIDSNVCGMDSAIYTVTVRDPIQIDLTADFSKLGNNGCAPVTIDFFDKTIGRMNYRRWNFGNGITSGASNPTYTYTTPGEYIFSLTQGNECERITLGDTVRVYGKPEAKIATIDSTCNPAVVRFTNQTPFYSPAATFLWTLPDNSTSTAVQPPDMILNNPGNYAVTLVVTDSCGTDSTTLLFRVVGFPKADFSVAGVCEGNPSPFNNLSSIGTNDGGISQFLWRFGDGTTSNDKTPVHSYLGNGNFSVTLVATSSRGCMDSITKKVSVFRQPTLSMSKSATTYCPESRVTLNAVVNLGGASLDSLFWDLADGTIIKDSLQIEHQFALSGNYPVRFELVTTDGCSSTGTLGTKIHKNPVIAAFSDSVCLGDSTLWRDLTDSLVSRRWDTDLDGVFDQSIDSFKHLFSVSGTNHVRIKVRNINRCLTIDTLEAIVFANPIASIGLTKDSICQADSITLNNQSLGADTFYWNFNDGKPAIAAHSASDIVYSVGFISPRYVDLLAVSKEGCKSTDKDTIWSIYRPKANFVFQDSVDCAPFKVQLQNASTYSSHYEWFVDGIGQSTSLHLDPYHIKKALDTSSILLIAHNVLGCHSDSIERAFSTFENPIAQFSKNVSNGCGPLTVNFTNTSVSTISQFWQLNDTSSAFKNSSATFTASASKDSIHFIQLEGVSANGCRDTIVDSVTVYPNPIARFGADTYDGCGPLDVNFTNSSLPNDTGSIKDMSFLWKFGNGAQSTRRDSALAFLAGKKQDSLYKVFLVAISEHGCRDSFDKTITVYPSPSIDFSSTATKGCHPLNTSLLNLSSPKDTGNISMMAFRWNWNKGSSQNQDQVLQFTNTGTVDSSYSTELIGTSEHGCRDSITKSFVVYPNPKADFSMDTSRGCGPLWISFTGLSVGTQLETWVFEDRFKSFGPKTKHRFDPSNTNDTFYDAKLIAQTIHGCLDSTMKNIHVYPKPIADFTPDINAGCAPLSVNFTNLSYPNDTGTINDMRFEWDFQSFNQSVQDVSSTFMASKTMDTLHNVKLKVFSEHGCVDSTVKKIRVYPNPTLGITPTVKQGCGPLSVQFINWSKPNDISTILDMQFQWDYGNGDTSSDRFGHSIFSSPQFQDTTYQVQVIGKTEHLCEDTFYVPITLHPQPMAHFEPNLPAGCSPLNVEFSNYSSPADTGGIGSMQFIWDLDNGIKSRKEVPTYVYRNYGHRDSSFNVELIAISKWQCRDTVQKTVVVHPLPKADFSTNELFACSPFEVRTENLTQWANQYEWSVGLKTVSQGENLSAWLKSTPANDSTFHIKLRAITNRGCVDSAIRDIRIFRQVVANFDGLHTGCTPYDASFHDESKNALIHIWTFGDGISSSHPHPVHRYINEGEFGVTLKIIDATGCSDSTEIPKAVVLNKTPDARITLDTLQNELPDAVFNMQPTVWVSDGTVDYLWSSDGQDDGKTAQNSYTYDSKGPKKIVLKASTNHCVDSSIANIDVLLPIPTPGFESDIKDGCVALEVAFTDTSEWAAQVEWFFGDGRSSKQRNPIHTYKLPGVYKVSQKVSNERGQNYTTVEDFITVYGLPYVDFDPTPKHVFLPEADVTFNNLSFNAVSFEWFKNDSLFSLDSVPFYRFTDEGQYDIKLVGKSEEGCIDSITHYNLVDVRAQGDVYIPSAFTPDGDGSNDGFRPIGYGIETKGYNLKIFNRWGERVFESLDKEEEWDGSFAGIACEQDVYVWVVRLEFASGEIRYERGNVTLIW